MKNILLFTRVSALFCASFCALILLTSCSSEPTVTRWETVEDFNASQEFVDYVIDDMGYEASHYRASTYYKYVLYDDHKVCRENCFCTASDSRDHISPNDRCIKCGRPWSAHEDF